LTKCDSGRNVEISTKKKKMADLLTVHSFKNYMYFNVIEKELCKRCCKWREDTAPENKELLLYYNYSYKPIQLITVWH